MQQDGISRQTLKRLPTYLDYLKTLPEEKGATISANAIAAALNLGEVKVRKDLAVVSDAGRPKVGYLVEDLKRDLTRFLSCRQSDTAVLVGVGRLGHAMLSYDWLSAYGLRILAGFDAEEALVGDRINGVPVLPPERIADFCRENGVRIGILTVPAAAAQGCLDELVRGGVRAVWNFAPIHLDAPQGVLVQRENMSGSLAILVHHLKQSE